MTIFSVTHKIQKHQFPKTNQKRSDVMEVLTNHVYNMILYGLEETFPGFRNKDYWDERFLYNLHLRHWTQR